MCCVLLRGILGDLVLCLLRSLGSVELLLQGRGLGSRHKDRRGVDLVLAAWSPGARKTVASKCGSTSPETSRSCRLYSFPWSEDDVQVRDESLVFGLTEMKRLATWPASKAQFTVSPPKTVATFSLGRQFNQRALQERRADHRGRVCGDDAHGARRAGLRMRLGLRGGVGVPCEYGGGDDKQRCFHTSLLLSSAVTPVPRRRSGRYLPGAILLDQLAWRRTRSFGLVEKIE